MNPPRIDIFLTLFNQIGGKMLYLCWPKQLLNSCCSDLSNGPNAPEGLYGISRASVKSDNMSDKTLTSYTFEGQLVPYSELKLSALYSYTLKE